MGPTAGLETRTVQPTASRLTTFLESRLTEEQLNKDVLQDRQ